MVEITLFELHVDDLEFGDAPFARSGGRSKPSTDRDAGSDDEGGSSLVPKLLGILVIAGVVYGVRRFLGDGDGDEPEFASEESAEPLAAD